MKRDQRTKWNPKPKVNEEAETKWCRYLLDRREVNACHTNPKPRPPSKEEPKETWINAVSKRYCRWMQEPRGSRSAAVGQCRNPDLDQKRSGIVGECRIKGSDEWFKPCNLNAGTQIWVLWPETVGECRIKVECRSGRSKEECECRPNR